MSEEECDIGHAYHSLKNSRIRSNVFNYVCNSSQELSAIEIATTLGYSERSVLGALIGDGKRYKKEDSLVGLGLMNSHQYNFHGHIIHLFSATENGRKIFKENKLKEYSNNTKDASIIRADTLKSNQEGIACKGQTS